MAAIAYYNEIDPYCAQWLRNLIAAGHIAPGDVDERSIEDVGPADLHGYAQCHFFAGIGVWSHALRLAGWPDDRPVWTGSCPCQPFSAAGKGEGFADERHLWPAWFHLISQCRPTIVFGEQVASKNADTWIDLVQNDMEALGYAVGAVPFPSAGVGAPHIRDRLYWMADSDQQQRNGRRRIGQGRRVESAIGGATGPTNGFWRTADWLACRDGKWRPVEASAQPLVDGSAESLGRVRPEVIAQVEEEINATTTQTEGGRTTAMRALLETLGAEAKCCWPAGRIPGLHEAPFLLAFLRQLQAQGWNLAEGVALSRAEATSGVLRSVWHDQALAGTSRRRGLDEQRSGERADVVRVLSCILARYASEAWGDAYAAYAEIGLPIGHNAPARMGRLRAYGNAVNAQAARLFIECAME